MWMLSLALLELTREKVQKHTQERPSDTAKSCAGHHQNTIFGGSWDSQTAQKRGNQKGWVVGALSFLPALCKSKKYVSCLELDPCWGKTSIPVKTRSSLIFKSFSQKDPNLETHSQLFPPVSVPNPLSYLHIHARKHWVKRINQNLPTQTLI